MVVVVVLVVVVVVAGPESDGHRGHSCDGARGPGGSVGGALEGSPGGPKGPQKGSQKGRGPGKGCESKGKCGLCHRKRKKRIKKESK
jgi:hypothetical protein